MLADLDEFMRAGMLGEIGLGSTPEHVVRCVGQPDDTSVVLVPATIWRFGNVQIHCTLSAVEMITVQITSTQIFTSESKIRFEGWFPPADLAFEAFAEHLDLVGLKWQIDPLLTSGSQKTVSVCTSAVAAVFVDDELQKLGLAGPLFRPASGPKHRKRARP